MAESPQKSSACSGVNAVEPSRDQSRKADKGPIYGLPRASAHSCGDGPGEVALRVKCEAMPKRTGWAGRSSRHERGYGTAWVKLRQAVLRRDSHLCQVCLKIGRPKPARDVDHIRPKANGGTDDMANLQAICSECHAAKTARDSGRSPKPRIGLDGWPIA